MPRHANLPRHTMVSRPAIITFPGVDRPSPPVDAPDDLRAEIDRLQGELVQIREQLTRAQRLESIGALAGGIAHDLNNVLTPILMSIALLEEQLTDVESRRLLGVLHQSAQRGATMVQQILTLTRDLKRTPASAHPRQLLEDLRKLIAESFPHSIELVIEVAADVAGVSADPTQLRQLLVNLCVDARDAMPGGGLLTLRAENATVDAVEASRFDGVQPGAYVVISVADSRSLSVPDVRNTQVERPDGFVTREYEAGRGNIARVFVRASGRPSDLTHDNDADWPRGRDELVLVVDDESSVRSITSQLLSAYGYRVRTAANGAEAVAEFAKHAGEIDVVLTDLMMPVMDGANTMRALRTIDPGVKVIASTGIEGAAAAAADVTPRLNALLTKPFRVETLLRTLRQVLDEQDAI